MSKQRQSVAGATLTADQNKLVEHLAPLVKRIAYHFMVRLPASVQVDDLIQAGLLGLQDAAKNFDDTQGAQFETYAIQRIRGSMLDELRQADWLPRNVRKNLRRIEAAISTLEQRLGRPPREQELADVLGVSLEEYQTMLLESRGYQLLHYEDFQESEDSDFFDVYVADHQTGPLDVLEDARFRLQLVHAIGGLPEREKIVMALYYEQEMNLKEIGEVLGVSESRVCQLHAQAVARLRSRLKEWTRKER
jgi:RNA polymerase sigma factor for flagellar operon FliA